MAELSAKRIRQFQETPRREERSFVETKQSSTSVKTIK